MERFAGKVAVVTGAGSGIGRAVATRLADEGCRVLAVDFTETGSDVAAGYGAAMEFLRTDVRSAKEVSSAMDAAIQRFGRLDVLCNAAGVQQLYAPLHEMTEAEYDRVLDTNLRGSFLMMKCALPHLIAAGGGAIVNVASTGGLVGRVCASIYAASKGAVIQMTKSAAVEYGRQQIRINAVCPGPTVTGISMASVAADPSRLARATAAVPLDRAADAAEIAATVAFLASDEASFINGSIVVADGGLIAGMPGQVPREA